MIPPWLQPSAELAKPCPSSWPSARAPQSTANKLAVKIAIPDGDGSEYFWLTQFAQRGKRYTGRNSNTPRSAKQ